MILTPKCQEYTQILVSEAIKVVQTSVCCRGALKQKNMVKKVGLFLSDHGFAIFSWFFFSV
jgi:hypothetical protein